MHTGILYIHSDMLHAVTTDLKPIGSVFTLRTQNFLKGGWSVIPASSCILQSMYTN